MKKLIPIFIIITIIVCSILFVRNNQLKKSKLEIEKFNNEYLIYENKTIQINTLNTLMNKAVQYNLDNNIEQDEKGAFIENDTNSLKIYIELPKEEMTVSMERLLINKNDTSGRTEKVEFAFSESLFKIKSIDYHKNKRIKSITFIEL